MVQMMAGSIVAGHPREESVLSSVWKEHCARALVTLPADLGAGVAHQKIEVDSLVRLRDGCAIELYPAAIGVRLQRLPIRPATRELGVGDMQMDAEPGDVELDRVTIFDQRQRASSRGFRRGMKHHGPIGGTRHPSVGDADR